MKRRRDTLYLKYLGSRLGEGEPSDSAAAERRAALGSASRPRPGLPARRAVQRSLARRSRR